VLHRGRLFLFLLGAAAIFPAMYVLYSVVDTLHTLDVVEADRDRWQRPDEIVRALDLQEGSTAVDLGSGAGYFTLRLSRAVGSSGRVLAVDIRKLPLFFLWLRSVFQAPRNIRMILGDVDDPHLPANAADAVLIANTYHELANRQRMLEQVELCLRPGGRLVIVDRGPPAGYGHEIPLDTAEADLQRPQFEIVRREPQFIGYPGDEQWWLLVASKR
jgi:ubiquinone/menaquinone biosynthesis C-methylase UbiE